MNFLTFQYMSDIIFIFCFGMFSVTHLATCICLSVTIKPTSGSKKLYTFQISLLLHVSTSSNFISLNKGKTTSTVVDTLPVIVLHWELHYVKSSINTHDPHLALNLGLSPSRIRGLSYACERVIIWDCCLLHTLFIAGLNCVFKWIEGTDWNHRTVQKIESQRTFDGKYPDNKMSADNKDCLLLYVEHIVGFPMLFNMNKETNLVDMQKCQ